MKLSILAALVLVAGASGCKRPGPPAAPEVVEVQIRDRTPAPLAVGLDLAALSRAARDALAPAGGLAFTDGGVVPRGRSPGPEYRLKVELRTEDALDPSGGGTMRALVSAKLEPAHAALGAEGFDESAMGEKSYDPKARGDARAAWQALAARTVGDVMRGLGAKVHLASGGEAAILAALSGPDDSLREEAMRLAGDRKLGSAVPILIKLLKSDDHDVRDRAIGTLAAIGDRRAVRPLAEVARFRDLADLPKVLDALAALGGPEARAYLEFVASGHDNPEIRDLAKQALGDLDRRAQRQPGTR